jgi:tetratricopeptide (TPR) repeat protein
VVHQPSTRGAIARVCRVLTFAILGASAWATIFAVRAGAQSADWTAQVRRYAEAQDWASAMNAIDRQLALNPNDMEVRAWRARVLTWSNRLPEAEKEYLLIVEAARSDPDVWMGLASVYLREGKNFQAEQAIDTAEALDSRRADIHAARGRVLRVLGERTAARSEFQEALRLDPSSDEARAGVLAMRGEPKQDLRVGQENDVLSYASSIHGEYALLTSHWSERWSTSESGNFYQYYGLPAEKFLASVTRRQTWLGAVSAGGAIGHDNGVIPRSEAFCGVDRGWKTSDSDFLRGVEFAYDQHWYWYESARILALNGTATFYLPQDWTFTLGATGARSTFSPAASEWKPSESSRLEFPVARRGEKRLFASVAFAVGTEDFAQVNQIGSLASQTYGSGLRFQITPRQGVSDFVSYQKRTQGKSDIGFGLSYDIRF